MYKAYITRIKNVRKHPNADRLQLGECFGNTVCVSLDYEDNMLGIYFPVDGQLSIPFAEANNLLRKKDDAGNQVGGYLDPDKRNITAIRLRGEKSDGLFLPLSSLESFGDITELKEGDCLSVFNGTEICCKYVPKTNKRVGAGNSSTKKKSKEPISPLFKEHIDTSQLAYNLGEFKPEDEIEVTLKMHGTSQRTGHLPVLKGYADSWHCKLRNWLWLNFNRLTHKKDLYSTLNSFKHDGNPIYDWGYVSGTRRTVLEDFEGGYYGSNAFRESHSKIFEGKLEKGETIYAEIVGFTDNGTPIMPSGNNRKINDKEFLKKYGETTVFSYGCSPEGKKLMFGRDDEGAFSIEEARPQSDMYVYRMTFTNEDSYTIEYTPDFMRYRCEQMGVKCVPILDKFTIPSQKELESMGLSAGEYVKQRVDLYLDTEPDPIGKTHIKEGVVVRILNRPKFSAYKDKVFEFKVIEGIIKDTADAPDMEEAESI